MSEQKKRWYIAYSSRLWVPVSIEGWLVTVAFAFLLYVIYQFNTLSSSDNFTLSTHWPMLIELLLLIAAMYWLSSGHVEKRY